MFEILDQTVWLYLIQNQSNYRYAHYYIAADCNANTAIACLM